MSLPILAYHALDRSESVIATDPAAFATTMDRLADLGWRAIDLADWIALGRPAIDRAFAITFDDGLASIVRAVEILARRGWGATAFLVTDRMGRDNAWPGQPRSIPRSPLLRWSDLADLADLGFRFGAHSRQHARLDRLAPDLQEDELRSSREAIEDRTGLACPIFAYPYGISSPSLRALAARHFDAALGTTLAIATERSDRYDLPRIDACYLRGMEGIDRLLSKRAANWLAVRRSLRGARRRLAIASGT